MPANATELAQTAQEQTVKSVKQSQQAVVDAVRTWATAVEKTLPETLTLPFADKLPSPRKIVETSFDFAEQLIKTQRDFAERLLDAASPVLDRKPPAKKQTSPAKKTA